MGLLAGWNYQANLNRRYPKKQHCWVFLIAAQISFILIADVYAWNYWETTVTKI